MNFVNPLRWFKKTNSLLVLQVTDGLLRFILRSNDRVVRLGEITVPVLNGRMFDVAAAHSMLFKQLGEVAGDVAVLLPPAGVHIHYLKIPAGLDSEELDYQVTRHITHELGLSLVDVYYDWAKFHTPDTKGQTILLAVARQTEIAQYGQLFAESALKMHWVCAEQLVWAQAFVQESGHTQYVVSRVENNAMHLYWLDDERRVKVFHKQFDHKQMDQEGFEYVSDEKSKSKVQLPLRFVVKEIEFALQQVLDEKSKKQLHALYVMGGSINWTVATPHLQAKLGLPIHIVCPSEDVGLDEPNIYGGLWQFSEQILKERR